MYPCTRLIFCTVLTVSLMTGLSSFGTLPQCDIVFTWDFSVFCHSIFLDSILGNYNGMKELFEKRKRHLPQEMPFVTPYEIPNSLLYAASAPSLFPAKTFLVRAFILLLLQKLLPRQTGLLLMRYLYKLQSPCHLHLHCPVLPASPHRK